MTELQKEFEATGYTSWINADLYPDGKIYTQEYTQWLERQVLALRQPLVSRLLLLLDEIIKEENEALGRAGFYNQYGRETHANNKYCLAIAKSLIERRFVNSD